MLPSFYLYGRDELDDRPKQVRKWIICSGAIESAALAHCHDERGSEGLTRKTLGQSVGWVKTESDFKTEIEVIRQSYPEL